MLTVTAIAFPTLLLIILASVVIYKVKIKKEPFCGIKPSPAVVHIQPPVPDSRK